MAEPEIARDFRFNQVIAEELGSGKERTGALSGPNLAREILEGKPAVSVVAMVLILATLTATEWLAIGIALAVLVLLYAVLRRGRKVNAA